MALGASPAVAGATFHATLTDCMDDWVVQHKPRAGAASNETRAANSIATRPASRKPKAATSGTLTRAWSWLQSRCAHTATKRLRVSETVSLGEKRFVALVRVEDREFLIGGGSSGVSMLTALETSPRSAAALPDGTDNDLGDEEGCE